MSQEKYQCAFGKDFYVEIKIDDNYLEKKAIYKAIGFIQDHIEIFQTASTSPKLLMEFMERQGIAKSPLINAIRNAIHKDSYNISIWTSLADFRRAIQALSKDSKNTQPLEEYLQVNPEMNKIIDHAQDPILTAWENRYKLQAPENKTNPHQKTLLAKNPAPDQSSLGTAIAALLFIVRAFSFLSDQADNESEHNPDANPRIKN